MSMLWGAILVIVALFAFLGGFIMGSKFTKSYLEANGLLLNEPKAAAAKGCGKSDCSCGP